MKKPTFEDLVKAAGKAARPKVSSRHKKRQCYTPRMGTKLGTTLSGYWAISGGYEANCLVRTDDEGREIRKTKMVKKHRFRRSGINSWLVPFQQDHASMDRKENVFNFFK